jgi:GR25 family glycosyltransferase involved in LPS biosynthesis
VPVDKKYKQDPTRHRDSQYNYSIALRQTVDGLIIEDDVKLSKDFNEHLEKVKSNIPTSRYAVALYSCYQWNKDLEKYPIDMFYGTQAMLYDIETARGFGEYLAQNIGKEPYDLALKTYIKKVDPEVILYATKYSLVQHIGDISTGLGGGHKTGHFIDETL